jgi:hypothetical protein
MKKHLLLALFFTSVYAIVRYAGFGNVPVIHIPVYIMNKAISMTAAESLFMASLALVRADKIALRFWSNAALQLVFVHVFLSLGILSKGYYGTFFEGDKMNLTGELVLLTGALGVYCFWRLQAAELTHELRRTLKILLCALVAGHLFIMGFDGWLQVKRWNGGLPPITLLSFLLVVPSLLISLHTKKAADAATPILHNQPLPLG